MRILAWSLIVVGSVALTACNGGSRSSQDVGASHASRKNVVEIDAGATAFAPKVGQTIYVPVYSSIAVSDSPHLFNLAINLSVRNTDRKNAMIVESVAYFDHDGTLVREYAPKPLRVGPLASADFFIKESDKAGGLSASFIVEWVAEQTMNAPLVESVMIGTANTQGVSFRCAGRVLSDLAGGVPKAGE